MKNKKQLCILICILLAICSCVVVFFVMKNRKLPSLSVKDRTAPVITGVGEKTLTMEVGETIALPQISATDDVDGDVTKNVKKTLAHGTKMAELGDDYFKTEVGGNYKVVYSVCDAAGNEATEVLEIIVSTKTPEKKMSGSNDLSVLEKSGALFYENFEKGPENELLYDNYENFYTLNGMESSISGNSLVVDYGEATDSNRVTLFSMMPYVKSGTWEISFDVKLVSGKADDNFYIMYTPNVDENVMYAHRMLLADMKKGEVRHITYEKVIEVLESQEGMASFFLCNSENECGEVVLMFDNFSIRRTDLEHTTYIPTIEELEEGFTYDWSDEKYATFGKPIEVADIKDAEIRKTLQNANGFSDRVMLVTDDSVLNGILAANNPQFYQTGREYEIEIHYYTADCHNSSLLAVSSVTQGRGIRDNLLPKRNEADTVSLRYQIGRGEEELSLYLFGYESEVYIGDITFKLMDRTDKKRNDYHTLTEKELYAGYTFDLSKNNLPALSGPASYIGYYDVERIAANLPKGYFKSGETIWINGLYELNLDFLNGHLKKNKTYDITFRFYSDLPLSMELMYLLTKDESGAFTERNLFGLTELGDGMYELHTQLVTNGTEHTVLFYSKRMLSMYLDSITVKMQNAKPIADINKGITRDYKIDFDKEWLSYTVRHTNASYVNHIPKVGGCGLYVRLRERLHFTQLNGFTKGKIYNITLTTRHTGKFGEIVGMFEDENTNPTGVYVTPTKTVTGDIVQYQFTFAATSKTKMFTLLNATPDNEEEMYITDVEILVSDADTTSIDEIASKTGYVSKFDKRLPALHNGQWTKDLPSKYSSSQETFYHVNLKDTIGSEMHLSIFDGVIEKEYYYTLTITGYLNDGGAVVFMVPLDDEGHYDTYTAKQKKLADGQTQLTYYFNGAEYNSGRECKYLRLISQSGNVADYDLYISQISLKAKAYDDITGTFDKKMNKIIFPNIYDIDDYYGNAESVIIVNNGQVALIDAGEEVSETNNYVLLKKLKELGVKKIDVVIMTHPHSDHYGAFPLLAEYFDIGAYYCKDTCWPVYANAEYMEKGFNSTLECMKKKVNSDGTKVYIDTDVDFGETVAFGDNGEFVFYYAKNVFGEDLADGVEREVWDGNFFSLGVRYNTKNGYDAYFSGDSAQVSETYLLQTPQFENCEIWQINHHGSSGPYATTRYISLLDPQYSVVCGVSENLKDDRKQMINTSSNSEICFGGDGDIEFDLNQLKPEREYKSLTEEELYSGHTFDLSEDNMPRMTSYHVDLTYMRDDEIDVDVPDGYFESGTAIKLDGKYYVNLEFMNGFIESGRTYDLRFRVYAPNGMAKAATYIEVKNAQDVPLTYHRMGYTSLGDGMYEVYCQIRCNETDRLFTLYTEVQQAYYIEQITVSMQDSKELVELDEGITENYHIDFNKEWLDVRVWNSNAGYVSEVPEIGGYGLYTKVNEQVYFTQLKGFVEGRTYQLRFTTYHTGDYGQLWGIFYDSRYIQSSTHYELMKEVSGKTVTYTLIFTANEKTLMFGLYNNNRNIEEEMYILSVDIESYEMENVNSDEIYNKGYASDFTDSRLEFDFATYRNHYWKQKGDNSVLHTVLTAGSTDGIRFSSFKGMLRAGSKYILTLSVNQISKGTVYLLPLDASNNQINGLTYEVNRSSTEATGKMTYTFVFTAPSGIDNLKLMCTSGVNQIDIYSVTLNGYGTVSSSMIHDGKYVSNFADERLYFCGNAVKDYKQVDGETYLYVKQDADDTKNLRFDSFVDSFYGGMTYTLTLIVDEIKDGDLVVVPLDAANKQIDNLQYAIAKSSDETTGGRIYTVTFTAPTRSSNIELSCIDGTNEMNVKEIQLEGCVTLDEDDGWVTKTNNQLTVLNDGTYQMNATQGISAFEMIRKRAYPASTVHNLSVTYSGSTSFGFATNCALDAVSNNVGGDDIVKFYREETGNRTKLYMFVNGEQTEVASFTATRAVLANISIVKADNGSYYLSFKENVIDGTGYSTDIQKALKMENYFTKEYLEQDGMLYFFAIATGLHTSNPVRYFISETYGYPYVINSFSGDRNTPSSWVIGNATKVSYGEVADNAYEFVAGLGANSAKFEIPLTTIGNSSAPSFTTNFAYSSNTMGYSSQDWHQIDLSSDPNFSNFDRINIVRTNDQSTPHIVFNGTTVSWNLINMLYDRTEYGATYSWAFSVVNGQVQLKIWHGTIASTELKGFNHVKANQPVYMRINAPDVSKYASKGVCLKYKVTLADTTIRTEVFDMQQMILNVAQAIEAGADVSDYTTQINQYKSFAEKRYLPYKALIAGSKLLLLQQ